MLTTFDLDQYVYGALAAGASGFLLKHVSPEYLTAAIRMIRSGDALIAPHHPPARRTVRLPGLGPGANAPRGVPPHPRELDVLQLRDRIQAVILAYETGLVSPGARDRAANSASARSAIRRLRQVLGTDNGAR